MFKKLLAVLSLCLVMSGCGDSDMLLTKEDVQLDQIRLKELERKIGEKSTFILMVSQNSCSDCSLMERTILPFSRTHENIDIVELKLDEQ
ncbi:hypothetical protein LI224_17180, partial [Erysipelatoclostridium ramosum]|uniref:hypothetical protein n=1 Tax=Thomasclavelia ramosa TaxID=1547 RepID=UPI003AB9847F|nr:hypothetical protein [Thomasclavelia ramosa]